jgi:hypothetical protein
LFERIRVVLSNCSELESNACVVRRNARGSDVIVEARMRHLQLFVVLGLALVGCATGTDAGVETSGSGGAAGSISSGGDSTGGSASGGSATGGAQSGGSGGTVTGGQGGDTSSGGSTTGGTSSGGATGGTGGTGGTTGGTGGTGGATGGSGGTGGTTGGTGGATGGAGGSPSVDGLSVRYDVGATGSGTAIDSTIWIFNDGTSTLSLDGVALYYYLTLSSEVKSPVPRIDWANIQKTSGGAADQVLGSLSISTQSLTPVTNADSYFMVTFSGGKSLQPGYRLQFHWTATNSNSESFVQSNDYSFNASYTSDSGTAWDHIVLKQGSAILWGKEP